MPKLTYSLILYILFSELVKFMKSTLKQIQIQNRGYLFTSKAEQAGISRQSIINYAKSEGLEQVCPGIYVSKDIFPDSFLILSFKNKGIVFSNETALYLHGLSEREPSQIHVSVRFGYNASHLKKKGVVVHTSIEKLFELGISEAETNYGNAVPTYDLERTLCDMVRGRKTMEEQAFFHAWRQYAKRKDKKLQLLLEYAEKLRVEKQVKEYLKMLL